MNTEEIKRLMEKDAASLEAVQYVLHAIIADYDKIRDAIEQSEDDLR